MSELIERLDELLRAAENAPYNDYEIERNYLEALSDAYPKLRAVVTASQIFVTRRGSGDNAHFEYQALIRALAALEEDV
jgi:hypothetical protein